MRLRFFTYFSIALFCHQAAVANPYWNPERVPKDNTYLGYHAQLPDASHLKIVTNESAIDVLRIQVDWEEAGEQYHVNKMTIESSGTLALLERSRQKPKWGSYLGIIKDNATGNSLYYDSVGTGKEYRKLARAINLRFPIPAQDVTFDLYAENPVSGVMEKVLSQPVIISQLHKQTPMVDVEIKELALATKSPSLRVNIYADGYLQSEQQTFWQHALKAVQALQKQQFPGVEYMSFYGVFHASNKKLGDPNDLGKPVPEHDSFLGLYYPYWDNFGRWYDVVYPTREDKLRTGFASAPYDYPLVLINSDGYWGIGNYNSFTAIPAANSWYFIYLLLHEFGHFFGLNEEYQGGGRTELEFAPDISEPWSQNITFLTDTHYDSLKWNKFVNKNIPLPTPDSVWKSSPPIYGAYRGGYADSISSKGRSHKPGLNCVMEAHEHFCDICSQAIQDVVHYSLG